MPKSPMILKKSLILDRKIMLRKTTTIQMLLVPITKATVRVKTRMNIVTRRIINWSLQHARSFVWKRFPLCFFVSQEARIVVKDNYTPFKNADGSGTVWCDLRKDIICLRSWIMDTRRILKFIPPSIRSNLTHLAFDDALVLEQWPTFRRDVVNFPSLKKITVAAPEVTQRMIVGFKECDYRRPHEGDVRDWLRDVFMKAMDKHPEWKAPSLGMGRFILEDLPREDSIPAWMTDWDNIG
jgi:hypothetical protein